MNPELITYLYTHRESYLRQFAKYRINKQVLEDCISNVAVSLCKNQYAPATSPNAYLYEAIRNQLASYTRKNKRYVLSEIPLQNLTSECIYTQMEDLQDECAQVREVMTLAKDTLSTSHYRAVKEFLKYGNLKQGTGVYDTRKSRFRRARTILQEALGVPVRGLYASMHCD